MMISNYQMKVRLTEDSKNTACILARITLPYTNPKDNNKFSSAISNPPGIDTETPALVLNKCGKGKVIYSAGKIEAMKHEAHRKVFINIIKQLFSRKPWFESNAYKPVEITLFNQEERKRFIISVLNYQKDLPNIPVAGMKIRINMQNRKPLRLFKLPEEKSMEFVSGENWIEFELPVLETFLMFLLEYAD